MDYGPAEVANLAEGRERLFGLIRDLAVSAWQGLGEVDERGRGAGHGSGNQSGCVVEVCGWRGSGGEGSGVWCAVECGAGETAALSGGRPRAAAGVGGGLAGARRASPACVASLRSASGESDH